MRDDDPLVSGAVEIIGDLRLRLKGPPPKAGPRESSPDLHLDHSIILRKLRQFQDAGHIIGDFTVMLGDPTWRSEERPRFEGWVKRAVARVRDLSVVSGVWAL